MTDHCDEKLNGRSVYLRMLRRIWIVPVCAAAAALVFGLIYTAYLNINSQKRSYLVTAKYYINFAFNEDTQKAYDYYNAATWNDLIFSDPKIADVIKEGLPGGMTMQEAREETLALVISDIRLLTVEVRTPSPEQSEELSKAVMNGLVNFGESAKEFESIEFLSMEEPALEIVRDRTRNAVLLGLVLGLLVSFGVLHLRTITDDGIYTPEEAEERYRLPVIAVTGRGEKSAAATEVIKGASSKDEASKDISSSDVSSKDISSSDKSSKDISSSDKSSKDISSSDEASKDISSSDVSSKGISSGDAAKCMPGFLRDEAARGAKALFEALQETNEANETREAKESQEAKEAREVKETNEAKEAREVKETNEAKEAREVKETNEAKEAQEVKGSLKAKEAQCEDRLDMDVSRNGNKLIIISPDSKAEAVLAEKELLKLAGITFEKDADSVLALEGPAGDEYDKAVRSGSSCVVSVCFGKGRGAKVENLISDLNKRGALIKGIVIYDADPKFLKRYYGD